MRLLDRYLFRELFVSLAYCLIGIQAFVVVFTVFSNTQKIQDNKLHFLDTIEYALGASMDFAWVVLPISLLLALLLVLTHFTRYNEITAMRAAGVSLWRVSGPYFIVGLVASVALFALNELLVPRSTDWADRVLHRYVADPGELAAPQEYHGYFNARTRRLWQFTEYNARTAEMANPKVSWPLPEGGWREIKAERAVFTNRAWAFFNASEYEQASETAPEVPLLLSNVLVMAAIPGDARGHRTRHPVQQI